MARRLHVPELTVGIVSLDATQSRHARDALRLRDGDAVELVDDAGRTAAGTIAGTSPEVTVRVEAVAEPDAAGPRVTIASAVPKGNRADWLAEKLSELGAARWQPIACDRSVVEPAGTSKYDRWRRIAVESAKQSKRAGVMEVDAIVPLADALRDAIDRGDRVVICDTSAAPTPLIALTRDEATATTAFVGPEGGWTDRERALFAETQIRAVTLGRTVLRIETAAVVAAAMLLG